LDLVSKLLLVGMWVTLMVISEEVPLSLPKILELVSCEKARLKDNNATAQIIFFIFLYFKIVWQNYPEVYFQAVNRGITFRDKIFNSFLKKN